MFTMAISANFKGVCLLLTALSLMHSKGYAQTADLSLQPPPDDGNLYLPTAYAFFVCDLTDLDLDVMSVAWTFNGAVFADASLDSNLRIRSNVDNIYGFDVNTDHFSTPSSLKAQGDSDEQMFQARLDLFRQDWRYSGEYQCVICTKNEADDRCNEVNVRSNVILFELAYFPPEPYPVLESSSTIQYGSDVVVIGQETVISCYSYPGNPNVEFALQRGSNIVKGVATQSGDFTFYNYTFLPTIDDDGVEFSCQISNTLPTAEPETNTRVSMLSALRVVAIPAVEIEGPSVIGYGDTLTLTCVATSATNTPIVEYNWATDLAASRYSISGSTFTIALVAEGDNGSVVSCAVVDSNGMEGSGMYTVTAMDPEDITTATPSMTTASKAETPSVALIVVVCIVAVILLILLVGALCWWVGKSKRQKFDDQPDGKLTTNSSTNKAEFNNTKDMNGLYTVSGRVSNSNTMNGYHNVKDYPPNGDYHPPSAPPYYHDDQDNYRNYPPYERSISREPFYPDDEKRPDFHYNTSYGYDDKQDYSKHQYDDDELVGDFTQPTDRQPAYGQGYDDYKDGYDEQDHPDHYYRDQNEYERDPVGYDGRDPVGYDDRDPMRYDDRDHVGYDDRDHVGYDDRDRGRYDERDPEPYDDGYVHDFNGPDMEPPRPPRDDGYQDDYYPSRESLPPQERYNDPSAGQYGDEFSQDRDGMYQKEDEMYPYDYEPYGERDQVPDGQEADFQGDPYSDPYYPPVDRMPDGGPPADDPYYGFDINPEPEDFGSPQKLNSDSLTSDRFDPSYV